MAEEKKMTSAENGSVYEEGALKIQKLTPLQVVFTVVGCGVGSGCLGTASRQIMTLRIFMNVRSVL